MSERTVHKDELKVLPFISYLSEDKSMYPFASDSHDKRTGNNYVDVDKDFRVGNSGGFLMNIDFTFVNTHLFTQVSDGYEENIKDPELIEWVNSIDMPKSENKGKLFYCPHLKGTAEYTKFWKRETFRRRNGMTAKCKVLKDGNVVDLHITGDHYNYLNYSRIMRTPTDMELKGLHDKGDFKTKHIEGFSRFWDGDYWNFKVDFFIASNNYHLTKGKARGKGYSYKRGSSGSNTLNLIPQSIIVLAADNMDYLTDTRATSDMLKINLDWFENNTHWRRFYLSENLENVELGYRTTTGGNKKMGWRSALFSVTLRNNESGAIGKRAIEIDFEEAGKLPNLESALDVTLSSTEVGADNIGTIRVYGTAGTKEANWAPFANVFFNPARYKMMPFENIWDYDERSSVCGFFHPQVWNMEPYMDVDGNSIVVKAYEYDIADKERQQEELDSSAYIAYVGQRANTPEEAFKRGGENLFSSPELSAHVSKVLSSSDFKYYRDGAIVEVDDGVEFKTNKVLLSEGLKEFAHPYIEEIPFNPKKDFFGCIREYYPPFKIDNAVPSGLYYIMMDTIAKDKTADTVINKNSLISIQVKMFPNNYANTSGNIIVAAYAGRPELMKDGDKILLNLCRRYNAKALVETDRGDTVSNFRKWKMLKWLYRDPTFIINNKIKEDETNAPYGIDIGKGENATNGLIYLRDDLYTQLGTRDDGSIRYTFHYITDIPLLREFLAFNINDNFDRISSMRVGMFISKALQIKKRSDIIGKSRNKESIYSRIGLYNK